jgi:hypothetical protein
MTNKVRMMEAEIGAIGALTWKSIYKALGIDPNTKKCFTYDESLFTEKGIVEVFEKQSRGLEDVVEKIIGHLI